VSKEALTYFAAPSTQGDDAIDGTRRLFDQTHAALLGGGQAPTALDGSNPKTVTGTDDGDLKGLLAQVDTHWKALVAAIESGREKAKRRAGALAKIQEVNLVLLRKMDDAVRLMTAANMPAAAINIAGRQRMLSQKVVKEALLFDSAPSPEQKALVAEMGALFEASHRGLRHGGSVPLKLDGSVPTLIDGVDGNAEIANQLDTVEGLWADQRDAVALLVDDKNNLAPERAAIASVSLEVLGAMNAAVGRAQAVAEAKQASIRMVNAVAVVGGLLLAIAAVFVAVGIGGSLRRLQMAADAISTGDLDSPVPSMKLGEIRDLSASFERMRTSLGQAMSMLAEDDDADALLGG